MTGQAIGTGSALGLREGWTCMGKAGGLGGLRAGAGRARQGGRRHRVRGAGLRAAGETSRKDPWGQRSRLGPGLKGLTGYCTHESLERSRAGDQRSPLDLRKVRDSTGASGKETSLPGRDGGLRDCKQECCCDGGMVQLHGPLLLRNFGLAVKRESQAEP